MGKINVSVVCAALINAAELRINTQNIISLVRFVEIFDSMLCDIKNSAYLSPWTELFSRYCSKFISSELLEIKCSIINYYINILAFDYNAFIKNQKELWSAFNLPNKTFLNTDLEAEGNFLS